MYDELEPFVREPYPEEMRALAMQILENLSGEAQPSRDALTAVIRTLALAVVELADEVLGLERETQELELYISRLQ